MTATEENKNIARMTAATFGGSLKVTRYWDDEESNFVDILECQNRPACGINSYATIGLSNYSNLSDEAASDVRVEIVGTCVSEHHQRPSAERL